MTRLVGFIQALRTRLDPSKGCRRDRQVLGLEDFTEDDLRQIASASPPPEAAASRTPGALKGRLWIADDFDAPVPARRIADIRTGRMRLLWDFPTP